MAPPVAHGLIQLLRTLGHDVPGLVTMRMRRRPHALSEFLLDPPEQLEAQRTIAEVLGVALAV